MSDVRVPIILGVTGHRDIPGEDTEMLKAAVRQFFVQIQHSYPKSPFKLISGLAEGADRLVAEVALDVGFDLLAALPMIQKDYEQDFESAQSLEHFRYLVSRAESCFAVPHEESIEDATQSRDLKYLALGRYIAKNSQIVIALWDGVSEQVGADGSTRILTGGTADVVRLCCNGIFSEDHNHILVPEITEVEQLWVRRQGKAMPNGVVGQWARQMDFDINNAHDQSKKRINSVLCSIDKFNAYAINLRPVQTQQSLNWLLGESPPQSLITSLAKPVSCYAAADAAAGQRQIERSKAIKWISGLAAISIICQQVYSGPDMRWGWLAAHILLALLAFIEYSRYFTRNNPREQQYLDWRSLAEALRVQIFWHASGLKNSVADHYLTGDRDELDWIRQAARNTTIGVPPMHALSMMEWTRNAWLESQCKYFQEKSPANGNNLKKFGRHTSVFFISALIVTGATFFAHLLDAPIIYLNTFVLISGIFFLGSAVLKNYAEQMAFEEQKNRYYAMGEIYKAAIIRFDFYVSQNEIDRAREVLLLVGKEALTENAGWLRLHRQRQFEVTVA